MLSENKLTETIEREQYTNKYLAKITVKINCNTLKVYKNLVRHLKENNIVHHTYQLKERRVYRIVTKNLHYTTDVEEIKAKLS